MKKLIFTTLVLLVAVQGKAQQLDKIAHVAVGATIAGFSYSITHKVSKKPWAPAAVGMTLAFGAAVGKEIRDRKLYNSPFSESAKDIAFTTLGAGMACLTLKICF